MGNRDFDIVVGLAVENRRLQPPEGAELLVDVEVIVEIAEHAIDAQARRIGLAMRLQRGGGIQLVAILRAAEEIGLHRRIFGELAETEDAAVNPVLPVRPVELIGIADHGPHQEVVEVPVIVLLADLDAKAVEIIGRIAELVLRDEAPVEQLQMEAAGAHGQRTIVAARILAEGVLEIELAIGRDEIGLIDLLSLIFIDAVEGARVLELDDGAEGIENILDADIDARARQPQRIGEEFALRAGRAGRRVRPGAVIVLAELEACARSRDRRSASRFP